MPRLILSSSLLLLLAAAACTGDPATDSGAVGGDGDGGGDDDDGGGPIEECDVLPSGITSAGIVTCADPDARAKAPYQRLKLPDTTVDPTDDTGTNGFTHTIGVIVAELNGDDYLDLFLPMRGGDLFLPGQAGGTFGKPDADAAMDPGEDVSFGGVAVDIDADGDLDVLVANMGAVNRVLLNDGRGGFTEVTEEIGMGFGDYYSEALVFGDIDGDGDLDMFEGNNAYGDGSGQEHPPPGPNRMFRNNGDGTFTWMEDAISGELVDAYTRVGLIQDLDDDGDKDVYMINHIPEYVHNQVAVQTSPWTFQDSMQGSGLDIRIAGMGLGIGDVNLDGRPDYLISGQDEMALLESLDVGAWYNGAVARGIVVEDLDPGRTRTLGWGTELADLDNDGDLDAFVTFGRFEGVQPDEPRGGPQPDALWLQQDDGTFVEVADDWGVADLTVGRGLVVADLDRNGVLDLVKRPVDTGPEIYMGQCTDDAWVLLKLRDAAPNTYAIGAVVEVEAGGRTFKRWHTAGSTGFGGGGPLEVHVGLGDAVRIDRITVTWPDGQQNTFEDLCPNQLLTIDRTAI